ncbi:unnamed protein product [Sphagnum troendelagicum]|uniref:Helicase C-terminal domain-containing protein n=1 Tax=Sphagnum troendelagicum TaxID=128251 RepID=A0ABP0UQC6_9BRYO
MKELPKSWREETNSLEEVGDSDPELAEGNEILAMSPMDANKCSILNDLITVNSWHGDITQNQREKTLDAFHTGKVNIRVATDVAAPGLDVPNIDLVIRYNIRNDPESSVAIPIYSDQQMCLFVKEQGPLALSAALAHIPPNHSLLTWSENITTGYMSGMVCYPEFPKLVARNKQMPSKKLLMVVLILTSGSSGMWLYHESS